MNNYNIPGYHKVEDCLPDEDFVVETLICDEKGIRNKQKLVRKHGLWWHEDLSTYIYYTPTHWRY